ncbi:MAG: hypothetical protein AAFX79_05600 [Planctomycetota bacterium]
MPNATPNARTRSSPLGRWIGPLGWGFYLAVSWTWVIGMVLPAFMLLDYGWWALLVFFVPNAAGAAAMGFVLRDTRAADRLRERHSAMVRVFSIVTIAFHLFVLLTLLTPRTSLQWSILAAVPLGTAACVIARTGRVLTTLAALVWLASVALLAGFVIEGGEPSWSQPAFDFFGEDLLFVAPACALGFACCPYLDATFLRARSETTVAGGRVAFAFGFFGPFAAMIAGTVLYASGLVTGALAAGTYVLAHLAVQSAFTMGVHTREAAVHASGLIVAMLLAGAAFVAMSLLPESPTWAAGMSPGRILYYVFLSAYGLLFPAYVLLSMLPTALRLPPLPAKAWLVIVPALAGAAAAFAAGFIAKEEQWLPLGIGVLLAAAFATYALRRRAGAARG